MLVEKNLSLLASDGYRRTSSPEDTFRISDLTDVIWGRKWTILAFALIALVLAAGYLSAADPRYVARAFVAFDPLSKNLLVDLTSQPNGSTDTARIESEIKLMQSDTVLLAAAQRVGMPTDKADARQGNVDSIKQWLGIARPEPDAETIKSAFIDKLRRSVSVRREGTSYVISVAVTSDEPTEAADMANEVARVYLEQQVRQKVSLMQSAQKRLEHSSEQLSRELITSKQQLDLMLADIADEAVSPEMQRLVAQRTALTDQVTYVQSRRDGIDAALKAQDYDGLSSMFKAGAFGVPSDRSSEVLASGALAASLLSSKTGLVDATLTRAVEDRLFVMDQSIAATKDELRSIDSQLKLAASEVDLAPELYVKRFEYSQQLQNTREQYQAIMPRLTNMKAQADLQVPDSRLISQATAPVSTSSPDFIVVLGGALAGGLALGIGFSLAQGEGRLRVRSTRQLQNMPGLQGSLHVQLDDTQRKSFFKGTETTTGRSTAFDNSLARLRTLIDRSERERVMPYGVKPGRVISVTSPVSNNHRVVLSEALGNSYTLNGHKVLLLVSDVADFLRNYPGTLELLEFTESRTYDPITAEPTLPDVYFDPKNGLSVTSLMSVGTQNGYTFPSGVQLNERIMLYKRVYSTIFVEAPPVKDLASFAEVASRSDLILYCVHAGRYLSDKIKGDITSISEVADRDTPILAVLTKVK